jgi:hypothetical protein
MIAKTTGEHFEAKDPAAAMRCMVDGNADIRGGCGIERTMTAPPTLL